MNNWRLLLLAVVAVLQPIGSFTERNLIDGRQECCDHRSNSFTQETSVYGYSRKNTPEDRRLNSQDIREDRRRTDARDNPIRSRERLTAESTDRRGSPESAVRFNTEKRFARDQDRRQRSDDARESRLAREDQSRRIRESVFRDSLSRYERDALDSRRIRMSHDDTRMGRVSKERVYDESFGSHDARNVRDSDNFRRASDIRETVADRRGRTDVARDESRRDSRIRTSRVENRLQLDDNRERRNLNRRVREKREENKRSRSFEPRVNSVERDTRRTIYRTISERVDERRQRDQNRESRDRTIITLRGSSERISGDSRREFRDAVEQEDQSRRNTRKYRTDERIDFQRQHRDESRLSTERSSERRESRLNAERRQLSSRESRVLNANVRSERIVRSNDRIDARREVTRDVLRASRDINEHRQNSRTPVSKITTSVLRTLRTDETRDERRQPSTRSLDRVRSDEREFTARISERNVRDERAVRYRRDVRSEERLDEKREERYESRMSRDRQINMLRESRDSAERRQNTRSASPSQFEGNARSERESRLRERDNIRFDNHRDRETERRHDGLISRTSRFAERGNSEERVSRIREEANRERFDVHRSRARIGMQRTIRHVSTPQRTSDTRRIETNTRLQRARTFEDIRDERRQVTERDESRSLDRISMSRLSRELIERRESRETSRNTRVDARNVIIRIRGVRMAERSESRRQQDDSRSQDRVLQRQTRDILATRSVERRYQEINSRDAEIRSARLSSSRDDRINERDVRNVREFRAVEFRRDSRRMTEREVQPNRHNLHLERMDRTVNREIRDNTVEAKLRSDIVLAKDIRADTRREARDTRFRIFESKFREIDPVETSDNQNAMNWQIVFYTLQGAYLCGLLMQMLTEKSNKGKARNFTAWWSPASKDLVKVD